MALLWFCSWTASGDALFVSVTDDGLIKCSMGLILQNFMEWKGICYWTQWSPAITLSSEDRPTLFFWRRHGVPGCCHALAFSVFVSHCLLALARSSSKQFLRKGIIPKWTKQELLQRTSRFHSCWLKDFGLRTPIVLNITEDPRDLWFVWALSVGIHTLEVKTSHWNISINVFKNKHRSIMW